jgi:hypothetical protein
MTRAKFTDLVRQAMDGFFQVKGLRSFKVASGRLVWWPTAARATLKKLSFSWPDALSGLRQIVGRSMKRGFHWHYGVSCWARTAPMRHIRVASRVVFTSDGTNPLGDAKRLHRLRRSFCKNWRNPKWRDLLLTFWHWLGEGASLIDVSMGEGAAMRIRLRPMVVDASFGTDIIEDSVETAGEEEEDEDDEPETTRAAMMSPRSWKTTHEGAQAHSFGGAAAGVPLRSEARLPRATGSFSMDLLMVDALKLTTAS